MITQSVVFQGLLIAYALGVLFVALFLGAAFGDKFNHPDVSHRFATWITLVFCSVLWPGFAINIIWNNLAKKNKKAAS